MDENGTRQRRLNDLDGQTTIDVEPPSFEGKILTENDNKLHSAVMLRHNCHHQ